MALLFIEKVPGDRQTQDAFARKVRRISSKHSMNPNWLMGVMNSETGGSFSASQQNLAGSGATGLIQFMPNTARTLGTSTTALAAMSELQQLDYVDKYIDYTLGYLKGVDGIKSYNDLYMMVFYPKAIGKPDNWAFPGYIYSQNAGVDVDKDGEITIADFKAFIRRKIPAFYRAEFAFRYRFLSTRYLILAFVVLLVGVGVYFVVRGKALPATVTKKSLPTPGNPLLKIA